MKREQFPTPSLPEEPSEWLGCPCRVRGVLASTLQAIIDKRSGGGSDLQFICALLAVTVLDEDSVPVYTGDQWEIYFTTRAEETANLFRVARRVCGLDREDIEKNAESGQTE